VEGLTEVVTDKSDDRFAYGIDEGDEATAAEHERLSVLASQYDGGSIRLMENLGIASGWHCLEVGAGHGGIARWLAATVGEDGRVMATDIDTRFLTDMPVNVIVREHDIAVDLLPAAHFDLIHARAVLQHVPHREHALDRMIDAAKPGGWLLIEDIDWLVFDSQELPKPFGTLHHAVREAYTANAGYDGEWGRRMLATMRAVGLQDVDSRGTVRTMHGGTPSAEWYVMALARAGPALVDAGLLDAAAVEGAIAQARDPSFAVLSPLSISAWGRKPE
jgi:SAM-dependent methyltransferase